MAHTEYRNSRENSYRTNKHTEYGYSRNDIYINEPQRVKEED